MEGEEEDLNFVWEFFSGYFGGTPAAFWRHSGRILWQHSGRVFSTPPGAEFVAADEGRAIAAGFDEATADNLSNRGDRLTRGPAGVRASTGSGAG